MSYFEILNGINVNDKTENRNGLTYLSWAWAWGELKKRYPKSFYSVYENKDGLMYHHDNRTAWVKTGVTVVDGDFSIEHIEYLPVMDFRNKSIGVDSITSFDVNKAVQRSLTKAIARHGLGLYIYAGEDLPDGEQESKPVKPEIKAPVTVSVTCTPEELSRRMVEISNLQKTLNVTTKDMKKVSEEMGSPTVKNMTSSEYEDFLIDLKNRLTVA
jgi:hypothetical protein